jgi:hypothetical protein
MARRDPGKVVGYVEDDVSKVKTEVRLISDRMVFWARVGELTTENKDGEVVRKWIREQQKSMRITTWSPIIVVENRAIDEPNKPHLNGRSIDEAQVGEIHFTARRSYVATIGKGVRELDWSEYESTHDPMSRVDQSHSFPYPPDIFANLPWKPKRDRWASTIEIVMAYDENVWTGLCAIVDGIERSRVALKTILRDAGEASQFLQSVGAGRMAAGLLLPGAPPADTRDDEEDEDE